MASKGEGGGRSACIFLRERNFLSHKSAGELLRGGQEGGIDTKASASNVGPRKSFHTLLFEGLGIVLRVREDEPSTALVYGSRRNSVVSGESLHV